MESRWKRLYLQPQMCRASLFFWIKIVAVVLLVLQFYFLLKESLIHPFFHGDTVGLVEGLQYADQCLKNHQFLDCAKVSHFPLFQNLFGLGLKRLGFTESQMVLTFSLSSFASFYGLMFSFWWFFKKKKQDICAWLSILVFSTSPLIWYTHVTFNELPSALMIFAFILMCLNRASFLWIAIFAVLSTITKEVAFPFLIILGFLTLLPDLITFPRRVLKQTLGILFGVSFGIFCNICFNYFRFNSFKNTYLMSSYLQVHSFSQKLISFAALWASPNGGVLFFWPVLFIVIFGAFFIEINGLILRKERFKSSFPILMIFTVLTGLTYGFSCWFAPMGWSAWGPRLLLPWLPSLLFLSLNFYSHSVERMIRKIGENWKQSIVVVVGLFLISVTHWSLLYTAEPMTVLFTSNNQDCPGVYHISTEPDLYYSCINRIMWPRRTFALLTGVKATIKTVHWYYGMFYLILIAALYFILRKEALQNTKEASLKGS